MQRYILDEDNGQFDKEIAHHIIDVIRLKTLDKVVVCFNNCCYICKIKIDNKKVFYEKENKIENVQTHDITLLQALLKKDKNEFVIKYATMFGATKIDFACFSRTIKLNFDFSKKLERFKKIAKESAEVANLSSYPNITYYKNIYEYDYKIFDYIFVCYENCKDSFLKDYIKDIKISDKVLIVIGPEGGLTVEEVSFYKQLKNCKLISLGNNILKAECASLFPIAYLKQSV